MEMTDKQGEAIRVAFASHFTGSMSDEEFEEYVLKLFAITLSTTIVNKGTDYVTGLVMAAIEDDAPLLCITREKKYVIINQHNTR